MILRKKKDAEPAPRAAELTNSCRKNKKMNYINKRPFPRRSHFRRKTVPVALVGLIAVLALVEYRSRTPEWKPYQTRGIAIAIERLETALADSSTERLGASAEIRKSLGPTAAGSMAGKSGGPHASGDSEAGAGARPRKSTTVRSPSHAAVPEESSQIEKSDLGSTEKRRQDIRHEIESLKRRAPAIMEVRPFGGKRPVERCITCHYGIEDLSASHPNAVFGCVVCHGGNGADLTVRGAHRSLRGARNPASLDLASTSCGTNLPGIASCHAGREHPLLNRTDHVPRSLMATNAGIISTLRFQWGVESDTHARFGIKAESDGNTRLKAVPSEYDRSGRVDLAAGHFRKFCAGCHLWVPRFREAMGGLPGCPACHAPYRDDGLYRGGDPTINRNEPGHAAAHTISNRIPDDRCRACHNRSGRVGLNFHGEMESEQYGTPFFRGGLNDRTLSDDRFIHRLVPDIHHEKGLGCIDCHTGQDTMGDGTIHSHMADQIEIRCEDCHGSYAEPPKTLPVNRYDPLVQALVRTNPVLRVSEGDEILLTSKGRPLPHIRRTRRGAAAHDSAGLGLPRTPIRGRSTSGPMVGRAGSTHIRSAEDSCRRTAARTARPKIPDSVSMPQVDGQDATPQSAASGAGETGFVLTGKLDGREHPVTVITGKNRAHSIRGHERLECDACHSAWSPQCFGCHQMLDMRHQGTDQITGKTSPGRWVEGRGLFRFERHIYGLNARGKVGILVPG